MRLRLSPTNSMVCLVMLISLRPAFVTAEELAPFSVQIVATRSRAVADAAATSATAAGFGPIQVSQKDNGFYAAFVGRLDLKIDALLLRDHLVEKGFDGAFVQPIGASKATTAAGEPRTSRKSLFRLDELPLAYSGPELQFDAVSCPISAGGIWIGQRQLISDELLQEYRAGVKSYPANSEKRASMALTLAKAEALNGSFEIAAGLVLPIADGSVNATASDRWNAVWLSARIAHARKLREEAYCDYREILPHCVSLADELRCRVEMGGLLMELARSEKGTLAECRSYCEGIVRDFGSNTNGGIHQYVGTAALMAMETVFWEGRYADAISAADAVVRDYADVNRVLTMAMIWKAVAQRKLGRPADAVATLERAHSLASGTSGVSGDMFPNADPRRITAEWIAIIARDDLKDLGAYSRWSSWLMENRSVGSEIGGAGL